MFLRIASKYVNNSADVQDVVQDTLKTIIEKQHLVENQNGFMAWCHGILRNKIGNYYKKRARHEDRAVDADTAFSTLQLTCPDPSEVYTAEEQYQRLVCAMRRLDDDYRKVIWLLYLGYDKDEMLKQLSLSDSRQLKNKIFRSRKKLRQLLFNGNLKRF